jgi:polyisoprenoid-binding protein YceI
METNQDPTAAAPQLGRYEIDTEGSAVTFGTRHLFGLAPVRGALAIRAGIVDVAEPLDASTIYAEIETASFRTGNRQRDASVRSPRFLDAGRHPLVTFHSERIDRAAITGTLTVRGVTRPVRLTVEQADVSPRSFTVRAATRIDRAEFGVTASRGLAGRYLDVTLEIRCLRK